MTNGEQPQRLVAGNAAVKYGRPPAGGAMTILERAARVVDHFLDAAWPLAGLGACAVSIFSRFLPAQLTESSRLTLGLLGVFAVGMWKAMRKQERELQGIKEVSAAMEELLGLGVNERQAVLEFARQTAQLAKIHAVADDSVRNILEKGLVDLVRRHSAYAAAQRDLPISESPETNYEIIDKFGARMDAVSSNDILFWDTNVGEEYLNRSKRALSRGEDPTVTRIFIFERHYLRKHLSSILKILGYHLTKGIGFALVIEDSLGKLKDRHSIQADKAGDERAPQLDFALFNTTELSRSSEAAETSDDLGPILR